MNSDIFILNEVFVYLSVELIVFLLQVVGLFYAVNILLKWNINSVSSLQYDLEKRSYLVTLLIFFSVIVKIFIFPYFAYTLDVLSSIIPGAMCAAGVISANNYGEPLLILKFLIILFSGFWLVLNKLDIEAKMFPYLKKKFFIYLIIFVLFCIEFILNYNFFSNLTTRSLVTCCSAIFSSNAQSGLPFGISTQLLLSGFYISFIFLFISNIKKNRVLSGIFGVLFLYLSYYSVIYFFGTYIYELPTHHCPFCMLQKDYYFIGYILFLSLFLGVFFSCVNLFLKLILVKKIFAKSFSYANIFCSIFIFIVTFYVARYYIVNGVFL